MRAVKISSAESEVMQLLWEEAPLPVSTLVRELAARKGWRSSTTRTLLRRLIQKGAVSVQDAQRPFLYRPELNQTECARSESQSLLERFFGGNPVEMLVQLVEQTPLSPEDVKRLRRILAKKEK
ncbi:MAG: BlaI/MecI/CopY family transcriptional regulator [Verrucomicrobiia bacterium]